MDTAADVDDCSRCHGTRGGVKGNENMVNGVRLCDYCHADDLRIAQGMPDRYEDEGGTWPRDAFMEDVQQQSASNNLQALTVDQAVGMLIRCTGSVLPREKAEQLIAYIRTLDRERDDIEKALRSAGYVGDDLVAGVANLRALLDAKFAYELQNAP